MFDDDDRRPAMTPGLPRKLEGLSIEELNVYRSSLLKEIERVDQELARNDKARRAAEAFFKPSSGKA